ncbi:WW domain binding protein 1-like b [Denticeps clupeoides]|uniref:WW domain binding protein 1-like b n=1 Tax=Denticeps clupeoides TaxID=299321 RepID=A0AAY4EYK6_9TELE|nr:WW domain binding protein 1-like [Denticeps clupeoides]
MGLFLYVVGTLRPTEATVDENVLLCEGANNQSYVCEWGHCCGESQCCSYYYELWWFWLVWAIIFILSCCCVCHHRRTKHRLQQQRRQHEINLIAYREAHNYSAVPFYFRFLPNFLLPDYEEAVTRPPSPPPPYSASHTGPVTIASALTPEQPDCHCPATQNTLVTPEADPVDSGPGPQDPLQHVDYRQKPLELCGSGILNMEEVRDGLEKRGTVGDFRKDPVLRDRLPEDKERSHGARRRRFTGDSGIEVCICGRGHGGGRRFSDLRDPRELEGLLGGDDEDDDGEEEHNSQDESAEFCESCGQRSPADEEQYPMATERRAEPGASPHSPVCLLLHTISEQEGSGSQS